jgi:hypothetical protein
VLAVVGALILRSDMCLRKTNINLRKDEHLDQQQNWRLSEHEAEHCIVRCQAGKYTGGLLSIVISLTSFTRPNNSHVETVKCLINENYSILILISIRNCTFLCLMLGNFFRR